MNRLNKIQIIDKIDDNYLDWSLKAINAHKVWDITQGEGVKIAIIDSGVDVSHPDLIDNIKQTVNMRAKDEGMADKYGHGTMIAGLIAGKRTGVAPRSELYIIKSLDMGGLGGMTSVLNGITFAINHDIDILCMSLGMNRELPKLLKRGLNNAIKNNITVVCATGNTGRNRIDYPASYDNIISVGGVDRDLSIADFSNYGIGLDVVAPSVEVLSTFKDNNYARMTGTSMATPLVAGGIALIKSHYRSIGKEIYLEDIKEMMKESLESKSKYRYGYGIMDLEKLFQLKG